MIEIVRRLIIFIKAGQAYLGGVISVEYLPEICSNHEETYYMRINIYIITTLKPGCLTSRPSDKSRASSSHFCILQNRSRSTLLWAWKRS